MFTFQRQAGPKQWSGSASTGRRTRKVDTGHGHVSRTETAAALCKRDMQQQKRVVAAKDLQMHLANAPGAEKAPEPLGTGRNRAKGDRRHKTRATLKCTSWHVTRIALSFSSSFATPECGDRQRRDLSELNTSSVMRCLQ